MMKRICENDKGAQTYMHNNHKQRNDFNCFGLIIKPEINIYNEEHIKNKLDNVGRGETVPPNPDFRGNHGQKIAYKQQDEQPLHNAITKQHPGSFGIKDDIGKKTGHNGYKNKMYPQFNL